MESSIVTILVADRSAFAASAARRGGDPLPPSRPAHVALLRGAITEHGGHEVGCAADRLMVVFGGAGAAVRCAIAMQRALCEDAGGPALCVGVAAGEPIVTGGHLSGAPVIVASGLCDGAALGQILATDVVRQLAGDGVAADMAPAGTLRLAGVGERIATAEVRWKDDDEQVDEPPPPAQITVVVADDERLLRTGFRVILDAEPDIRVIGEAPDGRAALDVVRRRRPDVVLMDIRMPELDGLRAAEQIVADPQLQTAVIMLTTFDAGAYVYEALRIGASGFLLKDAPADRLLDAVRVVAAGEALLAPSITRRLIEQFARAARPPPGTVPEALTALTARELDVLRLMAAGLSNAEIAAELVLGTNTIKTHVARVLSKLGLRDRVQAVVLAYELGFVAPELRA